MGKFVLRRLRSATLAALATTAVTLSLDPPMKIGQAGPRI